MGVMNAGLVRCGVGRLPLGGDPRFFFWLVMGTVGTTDVLPRLVRHLHIELDRRELLERLSKTAQERQPAWIRMQASTGSRWIPPTSSSSIDVEPRRLGPPQWLL